MTALSKPLVLVPACNRQLGDHPFHIAGQKYVDAVRLAGCTPLIVPTAEADEIPGLLALADGVLLTGSPSNVHPSHFGEDVHDSASPILGTVPGARIVRLKHAPEASEREQRFVAAVAAWEEAHRDAIVYQGGPLGPTKRIGDDGADQRSQQPAVAARSSRGSWSSARRAKCRRSRSALPSSRRTAR